MGVVVVVLIYLLAGSITLSVIGEDGEPEYNAICFLFWPSVLLLFMLAGIVSIFYRKW